MRIPVSSAPRNADRADRGVALMTTSMALPPTLHSAVSNNRFEVPSSDTTAAKRSGVYRQASSAT